MIRRLSFAAGIVATLAVSTPSRAADTQAGLQIAEKWCSSCHFIGHGKMGSDAVPTFPTIANREGADVDTLKRAIGDPHPRMPDPNLTSREIDDVVAYILSLRDKK